jgi:hypothetical protein
MSAYTEAELDAAVEAYFKKHSGLARDCVAAALDRVAPGIAARALREAARDMTRNLVCADCANDLEARAGEIEAES